jgi:hypothetical protein
MQTTWITTVDGAIRLEPYTGTLGWARPGRAWLNVSAVKVDTEQMQGMLRTYQPPFALTLPGGARLRPARVYDQDSGLTPLAKAYGLVFDVPATFTTATLTASTPPSGTTVEYRNGKGPLRWIVAPAAATFAVTG